MGKSASKEIRESLSLHTAAVKPLSEEEVDELTVIAAFSAPEIQRLWVLFSELNADQAGCIAHADIIRIPQLRHNPLGQRILAAGAAKLRDQRVSFKDFVVQLSVFSPQTPYEAKLRFAFKVYDFDGDGKLGRDDLTQLTRSLVPPGVTEMDEDFIKFIVDKAMEEADQDGEGALSYDEFRLIVAHSDIASRLTIIF
mmetsp:Transcript_56071/g.122064  ORF Transcript_56071/g.122064 Transcript_56071/m.122064 type:complete len:197 (+) Transcript_56071:150-740(+)